MGRPPLALGTAGTIRCYKTDTGYRARVLVRDYDGVVRAVERRGPTKAAAERALKSALRDRAPVGAGGDITADSRVSALAEAWYAGLADLVLQRHLFGAVPESAARSVADSFRRSLRICVLADQALRVSQLPLQY